MCWVKRFVDLIKKEELKNMLVLVLLLIFSLLTREQKVIVGTSQR